MQMISSSIFQPCDLVHHFLVMQIQRLQGEIHFVHVGLLKWALAYQRVGKGRTDS